MRNKQLWAAALVAAGVVAFAGVPAQAAPFEVSTGWIDFFLPLTPYASGTMPPQGEFPDGVNLNHWVTSSSGYLDMSLDFPGLPTNVANATLYVEYKGIDKLATTCPTPEEKAAAGVPANQPGLITANWSPDGKSVDVHSCKDLSNVVLKFSDGVEYKFDDLAGEAATFEGIGADAGKTIVGVWVKSGNNASGDGPGYGEYMANDGSGFTSVGAFAVDADVTHTVTGTDTEGNPQFNFSGGAVNGMSASASIPIVPDQYGSIPVGYGLNVHFTALAELTQGGDLSVISVHNHLDSFRATIKGETSDVTPIPEPAAVALLLGGLGAAYAYRRRKTA